MAAWGFAHPFHIHLPAQGAIYLKRVVMYAGLGGAAKWKENMLNRASALFSRRGADLQSYIYGTSALADAAKKVCITFSLTNHSQCTAEVCMMTVLVWQKD